ncbi:hypothetical protein L873DRAFT_1683782, partial [Choiromyces venosus 120613-1]
DNAGWHTGGENRALEKEVGYQIIPWPLQSPDLNVIENLWNMWKGRLRKQTYMEDELWTAGVEEWNAIEQDKINELVRMMPQCIEAVI